MKDEYEGKDLEEAIAKASAHLNIPHDELHYEVLEQGRKGLLGLGTKNVRIRVMRPVEHLTDREILDGHEPKGLRVQKPADAGEGEKPRPKRRRRRRGGRPREAGQEAASEPGQVGEAADGAEVRDAGEAVAEAAGEGGEGEGDRSTGRPRRRRRGGRSRRGGHNRGGGRQGRGQRADDDLPLEGDGFEDLEGLEIEPLTGQPLEVQQTLEKIFELAGLEIEVRPLEAEAGVALRLGGSDRLLLRKRNAELLQALQLLLNRMARRAWPEVGRIQLSTNGSDQNRSRDSQLVELTHGAAAEVSKTGRTKKLRPMNAYERRLVHLTIREYSGLTSSSDGEGAVKRVRISKVKNTLNV